MSDWGETLEALSRGELAAFDRMTSLVTSYLARIGAYALRDSWDDLVQEVLLVLLESPPRSAEAGAIVRHVQTTTYRKYIDAVRRERGRRRTASGEGQESQGWRRNVSLDEAGELAGPQAELDARLELGLEAALGKLEARERGAIECRYALGCSNEEAAERLGVSLATYKRSLAKGLSSLREQLLGEARAR